MTKYVDAFLYAGEEWALHARVCTLQDLDVTHLGIIANRTHQGDEVHPAEQEAARQDLHAAECSVAWIDLSRFDDRTRGGAGRPDYQVRERAHRDDATAAACILASPTGLVMLSDVDEIPRPELLAAVDESDVAPDHVLCLAQRMHPWSAMWQYPGPWLGTTLATPATASRHGLQWMRDVRGDDDTCRVLGENGLTGGWHLSWWGDDAARRRKLGSFSHYELVHKADDMERYARVGFDINGLALLPVDPDELDWPEGITP